MEKERQEVMKILHSFQHDMHFRTNIERRSKGSEHSANVRKMGNDQFNKEFHSMKSHRGAWNFYTISISAAKSNSEELALAYGNRSALLIHLSKYKECLEDIERALIITKDNILHVKLLLRKVKCLHCLGSTESQNVLTRAEFLTNQITNESIKKSFQDNVEKTRNFLKERNAAVSKEEDKKSKILNALVEKHQINDFSSVEIASSEQYGRHLLAAKDIRVGDVIFIEKPVIECVNLANTTAYCSHCFKVCWANIPCDECGWAMFCSEKCKKEAWEKYHDIECSIWAFAKLDSDCTYQHLALRAIIFGLKEYGSLENLKAALNAFDECTDVNKAFMKDGKIQPSGLMTIYSLSRKIPKKSLKNHEVHIARMIKSVAINTSWFGKNFDHYEPSNYRNSENVALLGTLFLTFSKIGQINGRQMWNYRNNPCRNPCGVPLNPNGLFCPPDMQCCSAGSYLAPVTSLLNHSCFPNARVCYGSNSTVIVYATQPIKKGEQIFDCYSFQFYEEDIVKRQKILSKKYNIQCDCTPCQEKWPSLQNLNNLSAKKLKDFPLEGRLYLKNEKIIKKSFSSKRSYFNEKMIGHLRDDIDEALRMIPQPSWTTVSLMHTLQTAFEQIYGISLEIPEECNVI